MLIKLELQLTFQHTSVGLILLNILFFPWTVVESNKIHPDIRNACITVFKKQLLKEIRPDSHPVYNICKPIGLKLLTRFSFGLSHLSEHIFNHNYENCINPFCTCSLQVKTTSHFFLHYHYYHPNRLTLFNKLCEIDMNLPNLSEEKILDIIYKVYKRFKPRGSIF